MTDEENHFTLRTQVLIIGPSDTLYEGGFFKCHLIFPKEYPLRPPKLKVITDIWHPNIEKNGDVCISILHEPGERASSAGYDFFLMRNHKLWNDGMDMNTYIP